MPFGEMRPFGEIMRLSSNI